MATYSELIQQISELQKQAEKQRKDEYSSVVRAIKKQIAEYEISAEELGFSAVKAAVKRGRKSAVNGARPGRKLKSKRSTAGGKVPPKYRDSATGNAWTGRGKMPRWLVQATANGRTVESFLIPASA